MHQAGNSHMASGTGVGEGRAEAAALAAIESPLLESSINSATGVVWNITGPMDLTIAEVDAAAALICACVDENANIIFGAVLDPDVQEEVCRTLNFNLPCCRILMYYKVMLTNTHHSDEHRLTWCDIAGACNPDPDRFPCIYK